MKGTLDRVSSGPPRCREAARVVRVLAKMRCARVAVALVTTALLASIATSCGGSSGGPVTLTFWSWVPKIEEEVKLFEKSHPNINIKYVNAGQGAPQYQKLRTALKAGSGAPDVAQIEFQYIPTFRQLDALVDISEHGAKGVEEDYVPWAWDQVSDGAKVYAIPQDSGPIALMYRKDIFDRYNLTVPKTWAEYEQQARKLHNANPDLYMTDFPPSGSGWYNSLLWQAGSRPFDVDGANLSISINDPAATKVAQYWGSMIEDGILATKPDFTNDWYSSMAQGRYATWIAAAWGPTFLSGVAGESEGKWRVAPLPQWEEGDNVTANWGGSTDAVISQTEHPEEAAEFAIWLNHNQRSVEMLATKSFLFPVLKSELNSSEFRNQTYPFYGDQKINRVFIEASGQVDTGYQWSPFQDYVFSQMNEQIGAATSGKITLPEAMDNVQNEVVGYAKSQGFKVR